MAEDNEIPVVKNTLDGPVHIFKTERQMEVEAQLKKEEEDANAIEEISN